MDLPNKKTTGGNGGGTIIENEPTVSHTTQRMMTTSIPLCTGLIMGKRRREKDVGKFEVHTT